MAYVRQRSLGGVFLVALATGVIAAPDPPPQSQPVSAASQPSTLSPQRFNDLIALIEGQNSAAARRTGARELLRQSPGEGMPRLIAILRGSNRPAKVAVALALSDLPALSISACIPALMPMLGDGEAEVRQAAAAALAAHPTDDVVPHLKMLALDASQSREARLAAIDALGMMTRREACAVLVEALAEREAPIAAAAVAALERATAQSFQADPTAALAWWESARSASLADWQRLQIERLVRRSRSNEQRAQELEQRLTNALRESYLRTPEGDRPAVLHAYLTDTSTAVRELGLALVQAKRAAGKTLSPETAARTRELLAAPEPLVRAAAVRAVASLRDVADAERFEQLLASERHGAVRQALVNGLGYVGAASAAAPLLELLESDDGATASETVTALGRLAERGVLEEPTRSAVAAALLARIRKTPADAYAMRERLLWAASRVGDPRFGAEFVAALQTPAATVRLAAVRGIAVLADPKTVKANGQASQPAATATNPAESNGLLSPRALVDALVPATADPDLGTRRAAVEALAQFASSDAHAEALWQRVAPDREPEESIRITAWRGALRVLASRPARQIEDWLDRLPGDAATKREYALELLQAAEKNLESKPEARGELGRLRTRLATERAALNQVEPAIATYLAALEDLHAAGVPELEQAAIGLLRLALLNDRYDEQVVAALARSNPALNGKTLWEGMRGEIEKRLQSDEVDRAIGMLLAWQGNPPASMPAETQQALQQMLQRAREIRATGDAGRVNAALKKLRAAPDDTEARQAILSLGPRAVPALRAGLRATISAEQPDAATERRLHDLLKTIVPNWPGFAPDIDAAEKLKALDALGSG